jgi:putative component of membrane protein insertase Oxa1/YidC/SpoIIIJ protein YidD
MKRSNRAPILLLLLFSLVPFSLGAVPAYNVLIDEEKSGQPPMRLLSFYQQHISVHDGAKCRFYPTCSEFYKIAIVRYGPFWGTLMVIDRLFYRESNWSKRFYPYRMELDRYFDPVNHNYILNRTDYYR